MPFRVEQFFDVFARYNLGTWPAPLVMNGLAVLVVPLLWAAVGSTAAFTLGVYQDLGLLVAGLVALVMLLLPRTTNIRDEKEEHQPA